MVFKMTPDSHSAGAVRSVRAHWLGILLRPGLWSGLRDHAELVQLIRSVWIKTTSSAQ